jgi:hypothetical protein
MFELPIIELFILSGVLIIAIFFAQFYISIKFYEKEKSILWGAIGLLLPFGLNIYAYQIIKLEKNAGPMFERLSKQERQQWRRLYMLVLMQYLLLFSIIGYLLSPSMTLFPGHYG